MDIGENLDWIGHAIIDAEMRSVCGLPLVSDPKIPFYIFDPAQCEGRRARRRSSRRATATPMWTATQSSWKLHVGVSSTRLRRSFAALRLWDLSKTFGGQQALDEASLESRQARCTACSVRTAPASRR